MRNRIVDVLKPLDAFGVENPARPGTPDVNFIEGWLELKWLREWPRRTTTAVAIPHYTPQQRVFQLRRWEKGGTIGLLLQVGSEYLLFDGPTAARVVGRVPRALLYHCARRSFPKYADLRAHLVRELGALR